jgi:hypothetical protein
VRTMIAKARRDQSLRLYAERARTQYALQATLFLISDHDARQLLPWLSANISLGVGTDVIGPEQGASFGAHFARVFNDEGPQGPMPTQVSALLHICAISTLHDPRARLFCGTTCELTSLLGAALEHKNYGKALALMRALSRIIALVSCAHEASARAFGSFAHDDASARILSSRSASLVAVSTAAVVRAAILPVHSLPSLLAVLRERIRRLEGGDHVVYCLDLAAAAEEVCDGLIRALTLCAHTTNESTEPQPARRGAPQLPQ